MTSFTNRIMTVIRSRSPSSSSPAKPSDVPSPYQQTDNFDEMSTSSTAVDSESSSQTIRFAPTTPPPRITRRRTETVSRSASVTRRTSSASSRPRAPSYVTVPTIPGYCF